MIIGETKAYAILKHPDSGQVSFMPFGFLTPDEQDELRDFRSLRQYPPAITLGTATKRQPQPLLRMQSKSLPI